MSGQEPLVRIGQIVGTHGVKGGLKVLPLTDFPERFEPGEVLFLNGAPRKIERSNWHKGQVRIQLAGIRDMTTAETFKWEFLEASGDYRPVLEEGEFLASDLVGMNVLDEMGHTIGTVDEVVASPAHDLLRVGEALIPMVAQFVKGIDVASRTISVSLIPGMLVESEAEVVAPTPSKVVEE